MIAPKTEIFIFSVFQAGKSEEENNFNHDYTAKLLNSLKIPYKVLNGKYKNASELSFLIPKNSIKLNHLLTLCDFFNQECYLESFADRTTDLVYKNGARQRIGKLSAITPLEASKLDGYSMDPQTGQYWAVV